MGHSTSAVLHSAEFPLLAGSHLTMNNPALEFVKFICSVLELDNDTKVETQQLRKQLLKLIRVREFSKEAQFHDPSLSLDLIEVVCSFCSHSQELDLIRDQRLQEGLWLCEDCGNDHDVNEIEQNLIEYVQVNCLRRWWWWRWWLVGWLVGVWGEGDLLAACLLLLFRLPTEVTCSIISCVVLLCYCAIVVPSVLQRNSMGFQLQDLVCQKCHMVKADNLSTYCSCSGEYKLTIGQ